jgi:hypothetical protein
MNDFAACATEIGRRRCTIIDPLLFVAVRPWLRNLNKQMPKCPRVDVQAMVATVKEMTPSVLASKGAEEMTPSVLASKGAEEMTPSVLASKGAEVRHERLAASTRQQYASNLSSVRRFWWP